MVRSSPLAGVDFGVLSQLKRGDVCKLAVEVIAKRRRTEVRYFNMWFPLRRSIDNEGCDGCYLTVHSLFSELSFSVDARGRTL